MKHQFIELHGIVVDFADFQLPFGDLGVVIENVFQIIKINQRALQFG